jgi:pyrroloquinoline quinone biosynthesis protein B
VKRFGFILALMLSLGANLPRDSVRIVILGIAQDGGIPQIGCQQKICRTHHHFVSSIAIVSGGAVYLIDATPDLREQYAELNRRNPSIAKKNLFDGIFLTHAHMGHYTGLMYLGKESISTKKEPVYGSAEMCEFLRKNAPWSLLVSNENIELREFESGKEMQFEGFAITPVEVPHRKEFTDTHGFLIRGPQKTLLYISDIDSWDPVKDSMKEWLTKSNFAMLDGTFYSGDELPGRNMKLVPHPTIRDSVLFFQSLQPFACQIYFTHFNHTNPLLDHATPQTKEFSKSGFHTAKEWQEFDL